MHARDELEAQFRELEESHLRPEGRSSPEALRSLLAEDFLEIGSSGRLWNRGQVIEAVPGRDPFTASIEQLTVRSLAPGVALTTYRLVITSGGARTTRRSSIWVHRDGRWLLLFHQGTPVSVPGEGTIADLTVPSITSDQALRIARQDAERVNRDLAPYRASVSLEQDGWHVDYELKDSHVQGGGPHYVINPEDGGILAKQYEQ